MTKIVAVVKIEKGIGYAEAVTRIRKALGPIAMGRIVNTTAAQGCMGLASKAVTVSDDHDEWRVDAAGYSDDGATLRHLDLRVS
jgi:hypothetical protein